MMYGLRHDLREVGEAIFGGYSKRDDDPTLAGTLAKLGGVGVLAGVTIAETRRFLSGQNQNSGFRAISLAIATTYATGRATDGMHDFAQSQRVQPDIIPGTR